MDNTGNITIIDVAERANVSVTTVSRYLNKKYESMSRETRTRIEKVVDELQFRPNKNARSLKSQQSMTLGCVVADMASPFSSELIKGIDYVCKKKGYSLLIADSDNNPESEVDAIKNLMSNSIGGLIINTTGKVDDYIISISKTVPVVMADRCLSVRNVVDTVTTDNEESTNSCMKYLKTKGYGRVAFFTPDVSFISTRSERLKAYKDAISDVWGRDPGEDVYFIDANDDAAVIASLARFHEDAKYCNPAVFCVNGVVTLKVLQGMKKLGLVIGEDLGVCGFDDWGWADIVGPGITTIVPGTYEIGVKSAEMVIGRITAKNRKKPKTVLLKNRFFERGSTSGRE